MNSQFVSQKQENQQKGQNNEGHNLKTDSNTNPSQSQKVNYEAKKQSYENGN